MLDTATLLKSLDQYLSTCGKAEARKIDDIIYKAITDRAAVYYIFAELRMHRPPQNMLYAFKREALKDRDSYMWSATKHPEVFERLESNPEHYRLGRALMNLDTFRMPTGKRSREWIDRADKAVGFSILHAVDNLVPKR